jgi:uncharacterized protein (DUF2141 family)
MNTMSNAALFIAASLCISLASGADLTVRIDDVKNTNGAIVVALFNSANSFLKEALRAKAVPAVVKESKVLFTDLPEGDYAFVVYHDANANSKLDKNLLGIPTEDYGFSNNAMGKMGPPSFASAKFALTAAGADLRVTLK